MKREWEITTEVKNIPKLNNPLFIEGLPGIGNVGKIAVDFIIEELKAVKLYSFFSHKFPHSVFVNEDNLVDMPKLEIYYKKSNGKNKKRDLILLTGDIQPIDEESSYNFSEEILGLLKLHKCNEMVTVGGIGLQQIPEEPKVYCAGNSASLYKSFVKKGSGVEKNIFGVVGPIIGVSGVLLGLGQKRGISGVALLAETFGHPMYLGIKGGQEVLSVLERRYHFGINLKKLNKEILEVEKELIKKTKEWTSEVITHSGAGAKPKNEEASYIG
ncbi:MAG: PAC2 family protein [archaeon]|nr:PAC2 family protein [archaeon]